MALPDGEHPATGHPVALLSVEDPISDETLHFWGYSRREDFVEPTGSAHSARFQGIEHDGLMAVRAEQIRHGLSGAPAVSPGRHAIVGLVSATRDPAAIAGGFVTPAVALLSAGPNVDREWPLLGKELVEASQQAVMADRGSWFRVFPPETPTKPLDRRWGPYSKAARSHPSQLLVAENLVVPYLFREQALAEVRVWCGLPDATAVMTVRAVGGGGKSRFAIEACRMMGEAGWATGFFPGLDCDELQHVRPRMIVVDYAEARPSDEIRTLLERSVNLATPIAPMRLVFLSRDSRAGQKWLEDLIEDQHLSTRATLTLDNRVENADATTALSAEQRAELFDRAVPAFSAAWEAQCVVDGVGRTDAHTPLDVLYDALNVVLDSETTAVTDTSVADRLLAHEMRYWRKAPECPQGASKEILRRAAALATLATAGTQEDAERLLDVLFELGHEDDADLRDELVKWLHRFYEGPLYLNPVLPDRLGERLITRVCADEPDGGVNLLTKTLLRCDRVQLVRFLDVANRTSFADIIVKVISETHGFLVAKALDFARGTPDVPGNVDVSSRLAAMFIALDQPMTAAEPDNTEYQRYLFVTYHKQADLARDTADSQSAEQLYRQALAIAERLTAAEPGNTEYQRDLSVSYERLAELTQTTGDSQGAERLYRQALAIAERLTAAEPGNTEYQRDLSISYERLADLARETGDSQGAERLYQQALAITERLAAAEPGNTEYQRDLFVSYERLADLARDTGESHSAEQLYRQHLAIAERLAAAEPGNTQYQRDLSVSYERLAIVEGRLDLAKQALDIRERLIAHEPRRVDLAEELGVTLWTCSRLGDSSTKCKSQAKKLLRPFEKAGRLTKKGRSVMAWARSAD